MSILQLWIKRGAIGGFNPATSPPKEIVSRSGALIVARDGSMIVGR